MANNIANKLIVNTKSQVEIDHFLAFIEGKEDEAKLHIDFEKILPMPDALRETKCDTEHQDALYYFLMTTNKEAMVSKLLSNSQFYSMDRFKDKTIGELAHYLELGEELFKLYLKYGFCDWYSWRIYHWGTKWNAYDTYIESCGAGSVELYFYTAWSGVPLIIEKLAEMFPNLTFFYSYADEDVSYNCGKANNIGGTFSFTRAEGGSDEAMDIYIECWQEDWDNFRKIDNVWQYYWGDDE